jgi:hypothetical protein
MRTVQLLTVAMACVVLTSWASAAQAPVTVTDLSRLQTSADEIGRQVEVLKKTDATLSADVGRALAELDDEIAALRVKMRRDGTVAREEYSALRDRLETLRVRAEGQKVSAGPVVPDDGVVAAGRVPAGTDIDVKLQASLNSGTAKVEQRFEATTLVDVMDGAKIVVPVGSLARGFVGSVRAAGNIERRGSLTLSFDELRIGTRSYRLRASVTQAIDGKVTTDNARIGAGAAVGAIIGGILGGGKGALLGVLVGGGGTIAATEGTNVDLPAGTILRIRLDQALETAAP